MKRLFILTVFLSIFALQVKSQNHDLVVVKAIVVDGDTIPLIDLPRVNVTGYIVFKSPREQRRFERLVRNVKKVYPYARIAGLKLNEYDALMTGLPEKEQRKLFKKAEDELKAEFEGELKKLTFSQGKILLKLVDRETGEPTYQIVKDLRGSISAFFWQNLSRLFGYNLKEKYDPEGDDRNIEAIVLMIENGSI